MTRKGSRVFVGAAFYAVPSAVSSLLAGVSTALVARALPTSAFGSFAFAVSFLLLAALIFDFGLALPAGRLAARMEPRVSREVIGAYLLLFIPIGLSYCALVLALSFGVDSWFNVDAGRALALVAPLAFVFPFAYVSLWLAQGLGKPYVHAACTALGQALFVCVLVALSATGSMTVSRALTARAAAMLVGFAVLAYSFRPIFAGARRHVPELLRHARQYGLQVYVGSVLSVGTYGMDVLMLGALTNARTVGFYALAGAIASASGLPVLGLSVTVFRTLARDAPLDRRWIVAASVAGAVCAGVAIVLAEPFIRVVLGERYVDAARLVPVLAAAQAVRGVTLVYNSYLGANALGRELRDAAIALTASNVVFNFALIPPFGAMGAAVASLLALIVNLVAHVAFYRRSLVTRAAAAGPLEHGA